MARHSVMLIYCSSVNASEPESSGRACYNKDIVSLVNWKPCMKFSITGFTSLNTTTFWTSVTDLSTEGSWNRDKTWCTTRTVTVHSVMNSLRSDSATLTIRTADMTDQRKHPLFSFVAMIDSISLAVKKTTPHVLKPSTVAESPWSSLLFAKPQAHFTVPDPHFNVGIYIPSYSAISRTAQAACSTEAGWQGWPENVLFPTQSCIFI